MKKLILSCEHATAHVPKAYASLFASKEAKEAFNSHRGVDFGTLVLARKWRKQLSLSSGAEVPLYCGTMTRLLIDLNRSPGHRTRLSEFSRAASREQLELLKSHQLSYQDQVRREVAQSKLPVLHISAHSFTPIFHGIVRKTDIGLLYDPSRLPEARLAQEWSTRLRKRTGLVVHRNAPYRGTADGLPPLLRKEFSAQKYAAFEIEINQRFFLDKALRKYLGTITSGLLELFEQARFL